MTAAICVAVATALLLIPAVVVLAMDTVSQRRLVRSLELQVERADAGARVRDKVTAVHAAWLQDQAEKAATDQAQAREDLTELVKTMVSAQSQPIPESFPEEQIDMTATFEDLTDWSDESIPPPDIRRRMPVFPMDDE